MEKVLQTADKVQGMSFGEAKKTLGGLGVEDNGTIELLMKGREELSRMMETQKDYGGITRESIEQSISFNNAMLSLEQSAAEQLSGLIAVRFNLMFYPCAETVECAFFASQPGIVIVISV